MNSGSWKRGIIAIAAWVLTGVAVAQVPSTVGYQGRVTTSGGAAVANGSYPFTFRLFRQLSGGSALWSEDQSVPVNDSVFNVTLGRSAPLPATVFTDSASAYLEVVFNGDILAPRQQFNSTGYTFRALQADTVVSVSADTIAEKTTDAGVTVDGLLIKDGALANYPNNALSRQAIINGNFDIWQRGTSFTAPANITYTADRWLGLRTPAGGTLPTIVESRLQIPGDIPNAFYAYRFTTNGPGSNLGASTEYGLQYAIEHGTRYLCGDGKQVTVSFWARSDISGKKLAVYGYQNYGNSGSYSSSELFVGEVWTLTSSWTKYTHTFTTVSLAGKTFSANNDDNLAVRFTLMWGTNVSPRFGQSSAESFRAAGTLDLAQVQLCSGSGALPFEPKSFEQELQACQRYYEKSYNYADLPGTATVAGLYLGNTTQAGYPQISFPFRVRKRVPPTMKLYSHDGQADRITNVQTNVVYGPTYAWPSYMGEAGFGIYNAPSWPTPAAAGFQWTADAEMY